MQSSRIRVINTDNRPQPQDDEPEDDDDEQYEVEAILDRRLSVNGEYEYLVSWAGYGEADRTWEPFESLQANCLDLLQDFIMKASAREAAREAGQPPAKRPRIASPEPFKFPEPTSTRPIASTSKLASVASASGSTAKKMAVDLDVDSEVPLNLSVYKPYSPKNTSEKPVETAAKPKQTMFRLDQPAPTQPVAHHMVKSLSKDKDKAGPVKSHIRIRFRSGWVLEMDFAPSSPILAVQTAVRGALIANVEGEPFVLILGEKVPGGSRFASNDTQASKKTLSSAGLGTKALLHFDFVKSELNDQFVNVGPPLNAHLIAHAQDLPETAAGVAPTLPADDTSADGPKRKGKGKQQTKTGIHTLKKPRAASAKKAKQNASDEYTDDTE